MPAARQFSWSATEAFAVSAIMPMLLVTAFSDHVELEAVGAEIDSLLAKPIRARHLYVELARCLGLTNSQVPVHERRKEVSLQWSRFQGLDILLVEDVEVNREVVVELLGNVGLIVRIAENGSEALDEIARRRPDIILMDCQMPVMDGFTATRHIRRNPKTARMGGVGCLEFSAKCFLNR